MATTAAPWDAILKHSKEHPNFKSVLFLESMNA